MTTENHKLIQCADHSWAPWGIVCIHIIEGTAVEAIPMPQEDGSEVESDWMCPSCAEEMVNSNIENLRPVCMHCIRKVIKPYTVEEE